MKTQISKYDILFPEKSILSSLRDLSEGKFNNSSALRRALVVEIDHVGGKLEQVPKQNPKNSIRARIVSEPSPHTFLENEDLPVFWPLFPFNISPIKQGEHVYVIFDGTRGDHGLWISRIPEPFEVDDKNITPGIKKYQLNAEGVSEQQIQDTARPPKDINVSEEFQQEKVPKFTARVGDYVLEGSNNSLIVLGRDRVDTVSSGQKEKAGSVHIVVGRQKEEDLDIENDLSTITINMNSDIDANFKTDSIGSTSSPAASIGIRSDEIRIVARRGMKIVVDGGDLILDANMISLGKNASEKSVLGNKLVSELGKIVDAITQGPIGQLGSLPIPTNPSIIAKLSTIKSLLEAKAKMLRGTRFKFGDVIEYKGRKK